MKKIKLLLLIGILVFALSSCYTLEHTVGKGAQKNTIEKEVPQKEDEDPSYDSWDDPLYEDEMNKAKRVEEKQMNKAKRVEEKQMNKAMTVEEKQWYALWGAVPINEVSSKQMAGGAENYTIITQRTFLDYIISAFTGSVSITVQTVRVKK